jgi:hypothetical protein
MAVVAGIPGLLRFDVERDTTRAFIPETGRIGENDVRAIMRPRTTETLETTLPSRRASSAPAEIDLTDERQELWLRRLAEEMLAEHPGIDALARLDEQLATERPSTPVPVRLAAKLALSRRLIRGFGSEFHVSIVFAVYKEHNRLRTRAEHPHGENLLLRKVDQVDWLLGDVAGATWDMLVVDDGCPEASGRIAEGILEAGGAGDNVRVRFLERAIAAGHPATRGLHSADDSQKGGSIEYGMALAAEQSHPRHVIAFTDADLSTHLGQLGLLVHPILADGRAAAIGSRREPSSVAVKSGVRDARGKLFIYLWKRLIPTLGAVVDTQCGFKAFRAELARRITTDPIERRFAFDIELLLRSELAAGNSIAKVPIAWIDSEAASTTAAIQPYLPMLQSVVQISRAYLPPSGASEEFARFVETLDEPAWQRLVSRVTAEIADRDPGEFDLFDTVSVAQLRALAG